MILTELIDHIEANTSLVAGTDLWPHFFPKEDDLGVTIAHAGGTESESNMSQFMMQITSIGVDGDTAESNCRSVYDLLAYNNGLLLAGGRIFNIVPMSTPKFVHVNKHNYPVFTATIVIYEERT